MRIPATMGGVVLRGKGFENLALEQIEVPIPGPGQLLVRVDAAGICTSLIKIIAQGSDHTYLYGQDLSRYSAILGDEGSVTIARTGSDLTADYTVGDRYVVQPTIDHPPVNNLHRYRNGGADIHRVACGYTLPGHLAEFMLIPEEVLLAGCLVPIPDNAIPYAHAALAEPLSCCVSGQFHHVHLTQETLNSPRMATTGPKPGGVLLVVGLGAMGRMNIEVALALGAGIVIGSDLSEPRRKRTEAQFAARAREAGGQLIVATPDSVTDTVANLTNGEGVDDLIVAVGASSAIESSLPLLRRGGAANLFGGLRKGNATISIDANKIHYSETRITGSSGGTAWDISKTLEWMCGGTIDAAAHIAKIGGLEHALELIDDVRHQRLEGKAVLYPHRRTGAAFEVKGWTGDDEIRHLS